MPCTDTHCSSAVRSARLPVNLIGSPINYANHLIGSPITSQSTALQAAILCNAAGWADPATTAHQLLQPLLQQLEGEMPSLLRSGAPGARVADVSKARALHTACRGPSGVLTSHGEDWGRRGILEFNAGNHIGGVL